MQSKRALVTGGNRGIGLAIARGLAGAGHEVVTSSRDLKAGEKVAHEIGAQCVKLDVSDAGSIARCMEDVGDVDILINNAGVCFRKTILENQDDFMTNIDVMLIGPFRLICQTAPSMRKKGWGRIVNVSSGWGSFGEGLGGPNGYGVAKAGLNALTVSFSRELAPAVKVNAMCPGWVRTRMGGDDATRSVEEGADTALWLAQLKDSGPTGGFFRDRKKIAW